MRTTLTIDDDVAAKVKALSQRSRRSFKLLINEALRLGLSQIRSPRLQKNYVTASRPMGLKKGISLDNIQEVLTDLDGESGR